MQNFLTNQAVSVNHTRKIIVTKHLTTVQDGLIRNSPADNFARWLGKLLVKIEQNASIAKRDLLSFLLDWNKKDFTARLRRL